MTRPIAALVAASALGGCMLGPDYERPELELPDDYRQQIDAGESIANLTWWALFQDPHLERLIGIALEENQDLAIATARIEEARARLGFVRADQFPQIDAAGQANRSDPGATFPDFGIQEQYRLVGDLSFELDLWGRLRRSTEAARAELLATEEARRTVVISLIADLASAYLLLRDADHRFRIAEQTLRSRRESLRIIEARFEQGTVPMLDVNQAQIEVAVAAAELASVEREIARTENLIAVLLGRNPAPVIRDRGPLDAVEPPQVPAGLPAELLARRPDIRQAESELAAQTARIGAAQALRLPTLTLTGALGLASNDLSEFTDGDALTWSIGGTLLGPLFDAGRSARRVDIEKARTEQLLARYEQVVIQSLREVEDALAEIRSFTRELEAREAQLVAASSAAELSRARYDGGVTSYLEVLDSERSLFAARLSVSATRRAQLTSIVRLYKALGGGWEIPAGAAAPPAGDAQAAGL